MSKKITEKYKVESLEICKEVKLCSYTQLKPILKKKLKENKMQMKYSAD